MSVSHTLSFSWPQLSIANSSSSAAKIAGKPSSSSTVILGKNTNNNKNSAVNNQWIEIPYCSRDYRCDVRCNESRTCRQSIGNSHQGSSIARRYVHVVHEISAEYKATDCNCHNKDCDRQPSLCTVDETQSNEERSRSN